MQFKKIKYDGSTVTLVTSDAGAKWEKEETTTSRETPHPDFIAALASLALPVLDLCQLPPEYGSGLEVRGVSFSTDEDGNRGAVVTVLKKLDTVPAPLVLNTPHVSERADDNGECTMPEELLVDLERLEREAAAFQRGKRAQADMFDALDQDEEGTITISHAGSSVRMSSRQLAAAARGD